MSLAPYTTGNAASFRFYLTIGSTVTEVFPLNFMESLLSDEQEKGEIFYRRRYSGNLTFTNGNGDDDFDLLYLVEQVSPCSKNLLLIEKNDLYYWDGYFSTTDGDWDLDRCEFSVNPLANDDYADIYALADIQRDIINTGLVGDRVSIKAYIYGVIDPAITYTRNYWLMDVIEYLADGVAPGCTVSSDFFTAATNPATLNANNLLYLTIAQKSDIIRPLATDPATTALISWNELMNILYVMFQVKWDYDPDLSIINVEHVSWWPIAAGLDLRTQELAKNNKYVYVKESMPKYEKFSFMEADNQNFVGTPIWYDSDCINPDPDSNVLEKRINVTTDLEFIINNPDAISDEGFVILCNYLSGGLYYVKQSVGAIGTEIKLNMNLSWSVLHDRYYRHDRVLPTGYMNYVLTTFWSSQKVKQQECFAIVCGDYDPANYLTTELGETWFAGEKAKVKRSELRPSGEMKFILLYGPEDVTNTGVVDKKGISIRQVGTNTFYATLTEPAPSDLTLDIWEDIYDDDCAFLCTGANETWTITSGSLTSTFTFADLCTPMLSGYTNKIRTESIPSGWVVDVTPDPEYDHDILCL